METRKQVVRKMVSLGMRTSKALTIASMARSTYYYKPTGGKKGKRPTGFTKLKGILVADDQVIKSIDKVLEPDFIDYGYIRTTEALKNMGYRINKKKVYRLMKEQGLLYPKRLIKSLDKDYVSYSSPICSRPFELIEIDIKYIYIHGERRNAYLITMLDVFTRQALVWTLNWDMKTNRVTELLNQLFTRWLIPLELDPKKIQVKIRSDNGSQFIAKLFRNHLIEASIENEYIHPGTPQQNGHIEAFHNTLSKLVCHKYELDSINQARDILVRFFEAYNHKRIMKAILYKSPADFFDLWKNGKVETKMVNGKMKHFFKERLPANQATPSLEIVKLQNKNIEQSNQSLTHQLI